MYSAAVVLSGNGLTGISLISLATLVATLSDLFIRIIPSNNMTCFNI
jgi:hypothetical protein